MRGLALVVGSLLLVPGATLVTDHYPPWFGFHSEAVALVGLALMLVGIVPRGSRHFDLPLPSLFILALALLPWIQWLAGVNPYMGDAVLSSLYLCALAAAIAIGRELASRDASEPRVSTWMFALCVFSAIASAAVGVVQWLGLTSLGGSLVVDAEAGLRAIGNVGQSNHLGTICLMGICGLVYLFQTRGIQTWVFVLGAAFLSMAMALTQSRTSVVGAVCLAAVYLYYQRRAGLRLAPTAVAAWVFLYVATWLAVPAAARLLLLGPGRAIAIADSTGRWDLWAQVWAGIQQRFWAGYGWNQTMAAHIAGAMDRPGRMTTAYAHNLLLDMAAWIGVPGALILGGFLVFWMLRSLAAQTSPASVHATLYLVPLFVHSLLEYPFAYAYFLVPAGVAVGWTAADSRTVPVHSRLALLGVAVAMTIGLRAGVEYMAAEEDFRSVRFSEARIGEPVSPGDAPRLLLNTHLGAMLRAARTQPKAGMPREEFDALLAVCSRYSYLPLTLRCATAAALNGEPQLARALMHTFRGLYGDKAYALAVEKLQRTAQGSAKLEQGPAPDTPPDVQKQEGSPMGPFFR